MQVLNAHIHTHTDWSSLLSTVYLFLSSVSKFVLMGRTTSYNYLSFKSENLMVLLTFLFQNQKTYEKRYLTLEAPDDFFRLWTTTT